MEKEIDEIEIHEPDSKQTEKEIVKVGEATLTIDLNSPIEVLHKQATMIADSGIAPTNNPEAIMIIWATGKELGLKPMASLTNIYVVNKRAALNKHLVNALLQKQGWIPSLVEDFVDIGNNDYRTTYEFRNEKKLKEVISMKMDLARQKDISEKMKESILKDLDEMSKSYVQRYSFKYSQAFMMKLLEKDTWKEMPVIMMQSRALVFGVRQIAPQALMGLYEYTEAADLKNISYKIDEEGNAIVNKN